ncbi:MAG: hypothetical protein ACR2K0_00875 [Acidimicrobiales bacterium]|jgi:hypothetical protein
MVLSGGVGVFAVVVFVAAIAFGAEVTNPPPGARLGLSAANGPVGAALLVPRCRGERVTGVELQSADGAAVWRITAAKGSIDERYVLGAEPPPFGFVTDVPLLSPPDAGALTAVVEVAGEPFDTVDRADFDPAAVPDEGILHQGGVVDPPAFEARAASAANCQDAGRDLGVVTWLFVAAAAGVVVTYVGMVVRYWKGRSQSL